MQNTLELKQLAVLHVGPVDLNISAGHSIGLTGASGCGKSLLLAAIADILPHTGQVFLNNQVASSIKPDVWRQQVGLLTTTSHWWHPCVADHFTSLDEIGFTGLDLDVALYDAPVSRCSSGELQRLALLRLLANKPRVLLLDEPTANLDEHNRARMENLIADYQQRNQTTIIWVSHDQAQLTRRVKQQYRMQQGQLMEIEICSN